MGHIRHEPGAKFGNRFVGIDEWHEIRQFAVLCLEGHIKLRDVVAAIGEECALAGRLRPGPLAWQGRAQKADPCRNERRVEGAAAEFSFAHRVKLVLDVHSRLPPVVGFLFVRLHVHHPRRRKAMGG